MNSKDLAKHIAKLIRNNNQVSIPQLGTFVGNYKSAKYDEVNDVFLPPSKSVFFQSQIIEDDGLIVNSLANSFKLSKPIVAEQSNLIFADWKEKLDLGERISIENCGYLFKNSDGNIEFKQDAFHHFLNASFGLKQIEFFTKETFVQVEEVLFEPEVESKETIELTQEEPSFVLERPQELQRENKPSISLKENEEIEQVVPKKKKFNKRYLIALAILPIAFYAYWIPVRTNFMDTGNLQLADLNPFKKEAKANYIPQVIEPMEQEAEEMSLEEQIRKLPPEVETFSMGLDEDVYIKVRLDKKDTETSNEENPAAIYNEVITDNSVSQTNKKYHLIGGCFSSKTNAEMFANNLSRDGKSAFILDYNKGLHRVSIGQFESRDQAKNALKEVRNGGASAWILKK